MSHEPFTSIENPTLAHFRHLRHFRHFISLYTCRELSTNHLLFMQNKPNYKDDQMNVTSLITMNYKDFIPLAGQKNKPNSNPIKPCPERSRMGQSPKCQNECKLNFNKGLQKKRCFYSPNKQTQFKPNFCQTQNERKLICYRGL